MSGWWGRGICAHGVVVTQRLPNPLTGVRFLRGVLDNWIVTWGRQASTACRRDEKRAGMGYRRNGFQKISADNTDADFAAWEIEVADIDVPELAFA